MKIVTMLSASFALLLSSVSFAATPVQRAFECHYSSGSPNGYGYVIRVMGPRMTIQQYSVNGRFAALTYRIAEDGQFQNTQQTPKFVCTSAPTGADQYRFTIRVFEDRMDILQSSRSARYRALSYPIVRVR